MSILVVILVTLGGFLFSYDTGFINSVIDMLYVKNHISPDLVGFTATQMSKLVLFLSMEQTAEADQRHGNFLLLLLSAIFT